MAILGVGTEIVECVRIAKMIETHGEQFLERVYTSDEIEYCILAAQANQHFAKRFDNLAGSSAAFMAIQQDDTGRGYVQCQSQECCHQQDGGERSEIQRAQHVHTHQ